MAVNREYVCLAHGPFESAEETPLCPSGCDTVERQFRTAPGLGSNRTRNIDSTLERLAASRGLTDMNNRGGRAVSGAPAGFGRKQQEMAELARARYGDGWGRIQPGPTYNVGTGQVERVEGRTGAGVTGALAENNAPAANELTSVRAAGRSLGLFQNSIVVHPDPENLTLSQARPEQHVQQRSA